MANTTIIANLKSDYSKNATAYKPAGFVFSLRSVKTNQLIPLSSSSCPIETQVPEIRTFHLSSSVKVTAQNCGRRPVRSGLCSPPRPSADDQHALQVTQAAGTW